VDGRERLYRQFVAEEVSSALRHRLVNKLAAVGALTFHLRRQLPPQTPEPATAVLPMIDGELSKAAQALDLRFLAPPEAGGPVALAEVVHGVLSSVRSPGVEVRGPSRSAPQVIANADELDLALHCLVENAVEAVGTRGVVEVEVVEAEPYAGLAMIALEVRDDGPGLTEEERRRVQEPFHTTKPGRLGIGLSVARRIAQRWRGTIALAAGPQRGLRARLLLPADRP
jgi:signal transduction histidine kinase